MLKIAVEPLSAIKEECKSLIESHWRETTAWEDILLDPDWNVYDHLEKANIIVIYTVRNEENKLVGYSVFFVRKNPHYKQHTWALNDMIWVHPDYRDGKIGRRLAKFWEEDLKKRGVDVIHVTALITHPALGFVLKCEKYKSVDIVYQKRIA
jgi:ribosomal protein S18 acetylase RimI-like enzyme